MNKSEEIVRLAQKIAEDKLRREVEKTVAAKFKKMVATVNKQVDKFLASKEFEKKIKKVIYDDFEWRFENGLEDSMPRKYVQKISKKMALKIIQLL